MKLFWKFFFSTSIIALFLFSLGSTIMINTLFQSALKQETGYSIRENDILREALKRAARGQPDSRMKSALESITVSTSGGTVPFRVSYSNYETLYTTGAPAMDHQLLRKLERNTQAHEVVPAGGQKYFIRVASSLESGGETYFLETYRDITSIFTSRENQYQIVYGLIAGMLGISFVLISFVAYWLTRPIHTLAKATLKIAEGDFRLPSFHNSNDEIGQLSKAFSHMSKSLERMVGELEEAAHRQENFIASFAHELKTPMTSIIGYADMLRSRNMEQEQVIRYANHIVQEGRRLEALSLTLMELIVLKKQHFTLKKVPATRLFESVQTAIAPILDQEGIGLTMAAEEAPLWIEPDLMKTVCLNLLDNARKSIESSGHISFTGKAEAGGYRITISDNGKGIEEKELSRITEAFYMADQSRSRAKGGAGLGLTIASQIIGIHQAEMAFDSTPGKGTSVSILLKGGGV